MSINIFVIFGAGFLSLFTPCVLPLVPVYLATLMGGKTDPQARAKLVGRALLFSLGFVLVFTLLGLSASFAGGFVSNHRPVFMAIGAVLILLIGLKFIHVIEIPLLERSLATRGPDMNRGAVAFKSILLGMAFAAGWSPCIGPVLGAVLTYTALESASPAQGALYLGVFGLGLTTPLVAIAALAERMQRLLSRAGRYFRVVEAILGAMLIVIAVNMGRDALAPARPAPESGSIATSSETPKTGEPTMLFFSSPSCPVCQRMKPVVEDLAQRCSGYSVSVQTVDVTAPGNESMRQSYRILGVPTFVFLDAQGRETARLVGEQSENSLLQAASVLAGKPCPGVTMIESPAAPTRSAACDLEGGGASAIPQSRSSPGDGSSPPQTECSGS